MDPATLPAALRPPGADFDGPRFLDGNRATARDALVTIPLLGVVGAVYLWGLTTVVRQSVLAEATVSLLLPAVVLLGGQVRFRHRRLLQLFLIEAAFNGLAVASQVALRLDVPRAVYALGWAFLAWFVVQWGGFMLQARQRGNRAGLAIGTSLFVAIVAWFVTAPQVAPVGNADGTLAIFGADAPTTVRAVYVLWVFHLTFRGTRTAPLFRMQALQWASIGVALASDAFFHVRLLTAAHLFLLDLLLAYSSWPLVLGERFAVLPTRWHATLARLGPWIDRAVLVGLVGVFAAALRYGLDLR